MNENIVQKMYRYWILVGLRQSREGLQKECDENGCDLEEHKRQLGYLRGQIMRQYLKNIFLFPVWFIKILTPSFFKGSPNIWSNLKLILTQKEFHPLRMGIASWLIFSFLVIQGGLYYLRHAQTSKAAVTYTWAQTDWSGGTDGGAVPTHTGNRAGWTQYNSISNLNASSTGQITLATTTYTATDGATFATNGDDTGGGFSTGTNSNTRVSGGNVQLAVAIQSQWDDSLPAVPSSTGYGTRMMRNATDDDIYVLQGNSGTGFHRYSISSNTWTNLANLPDPAGWEAQMIRNGSDDTIYVARANNSTGFYSYSIASNTWTNLTDVPGIVGHGAQMIRNGASSTIYLARGNNSTDFYSYSIVSNTWANLDVVPRAVGYGAQMIRNGSDDTIYLASANYSDGFSSYSISGNSWTGLPVVPSSVGDGPQMLRDGSSDFIYLVTANADVGFSKFYRYSISGGAWTELTQVPVGVGAGSQMTRNSSEDNIYLSAGYWSSDGANPFTTEDSFLSYSISTNSWTTLDPVPAGINGNDYGSQMIRSDSESIIYLITGNGTGFLRYIIDNNVYQATGTFTSAMIDVGAKEYNNLSFTSSTVGVGASPVRIQIATNNDNATWNYVGPDGTAGTYFTNQAGTAIDVGNDGSRYLKYQIQLQTSNTSNTPKVSAVSLGYTAYRPSGTVTSSAFDSTDAANVISPVAWTENLNTDGDVQFQLRTASTAGGLSSATFVGPDGTAGSYFTAPSGTEALPASLTDGSSDRFFQYNATLTSARGISSPVLSDVTLSYIDPNAATPVPAGGNAPVLYSSSEPVASGATSTTSTIVQMSTSTEVTTSTPVATSTSSDVTTSTITVASTTTVVATSTANTSATASSTRPVAKLPTKISTTTLISKTREEIPPVAKLPETNLLASNLENVPTDTPKVGPVFVYASSTTATVFIGNIAYDAKIFVENVIAGASYIAEDAVAIGKKVVELSDNPQVEKITKQVVAPATIGASAVVLAPSLASVALPLSRYLFLQPLLFLGIRKRKGWGRVYNSLNKLPLALVTVRLIDVETDKVVQTRVTDPEGNYGFFVVEQGAYRIEVAKNNFVFPSKFLAEDNVDGRMTDIYHGQKITLGKEDVNVAMNIPIDPVEQAKTPARFIFEKDLRIAQNIFSMSGAFLMFVYLMIANVWYIWVFLAIHISLYVLFLKFITPKRLKGWGTVFEVGSDNPLYKTVVRLFTKKYNKLIDFHVTDRKGRYAFLVGPSDYFVTFEREGYIGGVQKEYNLTEAKEEKVIIGEDIGLAKLAG